MVGGLFADIVRYREYLWQSVARDLRKRYKRSHLGYLWSMLNPLLMMIILTIVFSEIMRVQVEHYSVFLFVALLPWQYFTSSLTGGIDSIRSNKGILDHLPVPPYLFTLSLSLSNLANLFLALVPLVLVMLVVGRPIPVTAVLFPVVLLPLILLTVGASLFFTAANVFFDDTKHLVNVMIQALYFLSPVLYGREHLPEKLLPYLTLNPLFPVIELMRTTLYDGVWPPLEQLGYAYLSSGIVLLIGLWVFSKASKRFVYFL